MVAAFSFGPLGAMTDLVVAPSVAVENGRELKTVTTSRGVRWAQRARRNPRTWTVSRPWQDPQFARLLSLAASGLGGDMYLYDRACARQNMLPTQASTGVGSVASKRTNLATNPSWEGGTAQPGFIAYTGGGATVLTSTMWKASGDQSLWIGPGTSNASSRYVGTTGNPSLTPGVMYTIGATIHLEAAQTGSLDTYARSINVAGQRTDGTTNWALGTSGAAPNTAGTTRLVVKVTIPADAAGGFIRLMNGSTTQPVWWDQLTIEEGDTDGSPFDGDQPGCAWLGERYASPSVKSILTAGVPVEGIPMPAVDWSQTQVVVLPGRTYTISCWTSTGGTPLTATLDAESITRDLPAPVDGLSVLTVTPELAGTITLNRPAVAKVSGVRVHEGIPDGRFYATGGTPCKVAVADPEQTYQLVTERETRVDYQVTLTEVGDTGTY